MLSLGIATLQPQLEQTYFLNIAKNSSRYGIKVYRFHPKQWVQRTNLIEGDVYLEAEQRWAQKVFVLPDYIYDRCFYMEETFEKYYPIMKQMKKTTTFLSIGLPNKWEVFSMLAQEDIRSLNLPKTTLIKSSDEVINRLLREQQLVLKPNRGSSGRSIFFLQQLVSGDIQVQTHVRGEIKLKCMLLHELKAWLELLIQKKQFIAQSFLRLTNADKQPFDVRLLIQKNEKGHWQESGRGLRIGKHGSLVSNLHHAGSVYSFPQWLAQFENKKQQSIFSQLKRISELFPVLLEKHFGPLFELGIDVGIDENGNCWFLEANSKPGHQTIIRTNDIGDISERPLRYCRFLHTSFVKGAAH